MIKFNVSFECVMGLNQLLKLPNTKNMGFKLMGIRKDMKQKVAAELDPQLENIEKLDECHLMWLGYSTRPKDVDNLAAGLKMILDHVKNAGVLEDDSYKYCKSLLAVPIKVPHKKDCKYEFCLGTMKELLKYYMEVMNANS